MFYHSLSQLHGITYFYLNRIVRKSEVLLWIISVYFPPQGLSFRKGTHDLYSASHDRSIKVWNVDENAYVETLWVTNQKKKNLAKHLHLASAFDFFITVTRRSFGHQDAITGLDSLSRERCVTAGGRDRSVRVWKIAEESQLVFHGHEWVSLCLSSGVLLSCRSHCCL